MITPRVVMNKPRIAFLGLGIMGSGMAGRLLNAGFPRTVFNRNREKAAPLEAAGARVASSPREASAAADVIISMGADDHASRAVWLGAQGALSAQSAGAVCIESRTVTLRLVRELSSAAPGHRRAFLAAPGT